MPSSGWDELLCQDLLHRGQGVRGVHHGTSGGSRIIERGFQESQVLQEAKKILERPRPVGVKPSLFPYFYACTQLIFNHTIYVATAYALGAFNKKIGLVSPFPRFLKSVALFSVDFHPC